ncbi:hypothetical protein GTA08_BOTSDO12453 [Neofusicoccum parvum]|uniref:Uncharacterized protein n=1 Tax=Neofusicoccum parvum TaxID=310453 RepID=A0ACB5RVR8_9PEZI|nr:hypothetical protein GTA08_BOTSDO12453 [Neofusicoccum parvum]
MFVSVSNAPRAAPSPTRPHKTWTFLGSPDCNTPPPEELLESFFLLSESCSTGPFSDEAYFEAPESDESSLEDGASDSGSDSDDGECDFWLSDPPPLKSSPGGQDLYFDDAELFFDSACPSPTTTKPSTPTTPTVAVLGLTPAGIRTATLFSSASCHVLAYDASSALVSRVATAHANSHPTITFTSSARLLASASHFLVCGAAAATPAALLRTVGMHARPGATVVLEGGALAVGTTRTLLANLVRYQGLLGGASPAGDSSHQDDSSCSPRIVAGLCPAALASIHALYARAHPALLTVATPEDAEHEALRRAARRTPAAVADAAMQALLSSPKRLAATCRPNVLVVGGMGGLAASGGNSSSGAMAPGCAAARRLAKTWGAAVVWADPAVAAAAVPWAPKLEEGVWSVEGLSAAFDLIVIAGRRPGWDFGVLDRLDGDVEVRWCCE